jgi:hypothetical protein
MKTPYNQRLLKYTAADESVLRAKLEAVRAAIDHPAEKGRSVEENVRQFIRGLLPNEYGVSSGFIAYHENSCQEESVLCDTEDKITYRYTYDVKKDKIAISPQLDIIIYDALRFGPVAQIGTCQVLPAESVYAYIEVKSTVNGKKEKDRTSDLEKMLVQSQKVRDIRIRQYHASLPGTHTRTVLVVKPIPDVVQIRAFGFALEGTGHASNASELCNHLKKINATHSGFFSGFYVYGVGFIRTHHAENSNDPEKGEFEIVDEHSPLTEFRNSLYASLYRFPRPPQEWVPAIDRYFRLSPVLVPGMTLQRDKASGRSTVTLEMTSAAVIGEP